MTAPTEVRVPEVNVQWKNTSVCLDFQCTCSDPDDAFEFHLDGFAFGRFQCPRCGTTWRLQHDVRAEVDDREGWGPAMMLEGDSDD